jgi:hypothetical protein
LYIFQGVNFGKKSKQVKKINTEQSGTGSGVPALCADLLKAEALTVVVAFTSICIRYLLSMLSGRRSYKNRNNAIGDRFNFSVFGFAVFRLFQKVGY